LSNLVYKQRDKLANQQEWTHHTFVFEISLTYLLGASDCWLVVNQHFLNTTSCGERTQCTT